MATLKRAQEQSISMEVNSIEAQKRALHTYPQGYLRTSFDLLVQTLGTPQGGNDPKTTAVWYLLADDLASWTVYDYRAGCQPADNVDWYIGGHYPAALSHAQKLFQPSGGIVTRHTVETA